MPALWAAMKLVRDAAVRGGERYERYVCPECDDDPLHDPAARKWVDGRCGRRRNRGPEGRSGLTARKTLGLASSS